MSKVVSNFFVTFEICR